MNGLISGFICVRIISEERKTNSIRTQIQLDYLILYRKKVHISRSFDYANYSYNHCFEILKLFVSFMVYIYMCYKVVKLNLTLQAVPYPVIIP